MVTVRSATRTLKAVASAAGLKVSPVREADLDGVGAVVVSGQVRGGAVRAEGVGADGGGVGGGGPAVRYTVSVTPPSAYGRAVTLRPGLRDVSASGGDVLINA